MNSKRHIDRRRAEVNMIMFIVAFRNIYISQQMFYYTCTSCHLGPLKPLTLRMDHATMRNYLTF